MFVQGLEHIFFVVFSFFSVIAFLVVDTMYVTFRFDDKREQANEKK